MWLETSDEHLTGTKLGVIKCRCTAGVSGRFDAKLIQEMRGQPWQPPPRLAGSEIRTHADGGDGAGHGDDEEEQPEQEEQVKDAVRAQELTERRACQPYNFYIRVRDISKCGPTPGCAACRCAMGGVTTQCGPTPTCKGQIVNKIKAGKEDRQRVRRCMVSKVIGERRERKMRP